MSDLQPIADRVEIEALRGEFTDATIPAVNVEFVGQQEIRAGLERLGEGLWDYLVQTTHPGTIELEGDAASGRAYLQSLGRCATATRI